MCRLREGDVCTRIPGIGWGIVLATFFPLSLQATPVNLNNFFADPTVTVATDGSSALLSEDPPFSEVNLANDPGLGDSQVIIAAPGIGLFFDYTFVEGVGEDDSMFVFLLDGSTGNSVGPMFSVFVDTTSSGTAIFDLTSLTGTSPGLVFSLQSGLADTNFNSTLTISNVHLDPVTAVPVPVAIANMVMGLGMLGMFARRSRIISSDRYCRLNM